VFAGVKGFRLRLRLRSDKSWRGPRDVVRWHDDGLALATQLDCHPDRGPEGSERRDPWKWRSARSNATPQIPRLASLARN